MGSEGPESNTLEGIYGMLSLLFLLLLMGGGLVVLLWGGALFLQNYLYTGPMEGLHWRGPVAALVLTGFFGLWCVYEASGPHGPQEGVVIPFLFSPVESKPGPKEIEVERRDSPKRERYHLKKTYAGVRIEEQYVDDRGRPWNPERVQAIIIQENGQEYRFEPQPVAEGDNPRFVDSRGWTFTVFGRALGTRLSRTRWDWLLGNVLLNFLHLAFWFGCLWLLLRFQWGHALVLSLILWLIWSLTVLPVLLNLARTLHGSAAAFRAAGTALARLASTV
jgi:hypothetical protein